MFENEIILRIEFAYFYNMKFEDTFKHKGMRRQLIAELRKDSRITDERIFDAFFNVPRHLFLDKAFVEQAYSNMAFQIGAGQTISHPITVAFQTQLLEIQKGDKILEIGTGSGYQTAILARLFPQVCTVERIKSLQFQAKRRLQQLDLHNVAMKHGDGWLGWASKAPFDCIIVTAAPVQVPQALLQQLTEGGRLVIPVGAQEQMLRVYTRVQDSYPSTDVEAVRFVPLVPGELA